MKTQITSDPHQASTNAATLTQNITSIENERFSDESNAADGTPPFDHDELTNTGATLLDSYALSQGRDAKALKTIAKRLKATAMNA
jgi:hypothetical protein